MLNQIGNRVYVSDIIWDIVKAGAPEGAGVFNMGLGRKFVDFDSKEEAAAFLKKIRNMNL